MKKIIAIALLTSACLVIAGCGQNDGSSIGVKEPIFFYSPACSHCQNVKDYITQNNIESKVEFSEVSAFANETNQKLFNEKAAACGILEKQRGVPMVYERGECYMGEFEAMNFFKNKAGL